MAPRLALLLFVLLFPTAALAQSAPLTDDQVLERGRSLTAQFYKVDLEPVWAACSEDLRAGLGGLDAFRSYRLQGIQAYGQEAKVLDEQVVTEDDLKAYVRVATFEKQPALAWYVIWGFDAEGQVVYFNIEFAGQVKP